MTPDNGQPVQTLFTSTSRKAGEAAARASGSRIVRILEYLREHGPSTLFEVAAGLGLYDHQISGRFTSMARDGLIERTGLRRPKPETGCEADVWRIREEKLERVPDRGEIQGYPDALLIHPDGLFRRGPILDGRGGAGDLPGIPYSLHADAAGLRLAYRVVLIECEGCGRPLRRVVEGEQKVWRCGSEQCGGRSWHLVIVKEPGGPELLGLVMKRV